MSEAIQQSPKDWQPTACILCGENCGLEVLVEDGHLKKIRGNKAHPSSKGYVCQKAGRLDYYQNHGQRLTTPLRRTAEGGFEAIDWDTAFREIAAKLVELRDTHGGHCLAYYGGGGQGNHLSGSYSAALREAMQTRYYYSSLAQEKTGDFWLNGKLFGRQTCHPTSDFANAEVALFIGTNPWQSHGLPRARQVLHEIAKDPGRKLFVIDPRRTKTAELADIHLAVRPGRDAFLLSAMIGHIVQNDLQDDGFMEAHAVGFESICEAFTGIPVQEYTDHAGVDFEDMKTVAETLAKSSAASVRNDLGIEQSLHSTLNSYLVKLLYLVCGQFNKRGTNCLHTAFMPLIGHSGDLGAADSLRTKVTDMPEISKIFPPNILPAEIDTDHPDRIRGLVVDSSNPMVTGADHNAYVRAFEKLECLVVIDVAMTETARMAHYVLPASSQYEKYEATFFNFGFPANHFHLRHPILPKTEGTLSEPEIYCRLAEAMGATPETNRTLAAVAQVDMLPGAEQMSDELKRVAGPLFLASQRYAQLYPEAIQRAGITDSGDGLGNALFRAIIESPEGVEISVHEYSDSWDFMRHKDKKVHLVVDEMMVDLAALGEELGEDAASTAEFPLFLAAGERRSYNANTIFRDSGWRKDDPHGALRISPNDARGLGLADGQAAVCESVSGKIEVHVHVTDSAQDGFVSLPHGYGLTYADAPGETGRRHGPLINVLTAADYCDPLAKTPYHKTIPVRVYALTGAVDGVEIADETLAVK